jgi:hypothetical protein
MEVKMASNKIKALALTSTIAMAAVIGSTSLAEARYCRAITAGIATAAELTGVTRPVRTCGVTRPPIVAGIVRCATPLLSAGLLWLRWYRLAGRPVWPGGARAITDMAAAACLCRTRAGLGPRGSGAGIGSGLFGWW